MKYLSVTEVAKALQKSRQWIWVLIKTGRIPATKIGNQFAIESEVVKQCVENIKRMKKDDPSV